MSGGKLINKGGTPSHPEGQHNYTVYVPVLLPSSSGLSVHMGVRRSLISDGCFDNGFRKAEVANGYEHRVGHSWSFE